MHAILIQGRSIVYRWNDLKKLIEISVTETKCWLPHQLGFNEIGKLWNSCSLVLWLSNLLRPFYSLILSMPRFVQPVSKIDPQLKTIGLKNVVDVFQTCNEMKLTKLDTN